MPQEKDFKLSSIECKPGIKRDGTYSEDEYYTDGQHTRFNIRRQPEKIGGYRRVSDSFAGPVRGMTVGSKQGLNYVHAGSANVLEQIQLDNLGFGGGIADRTPVGFAADANNIWQFAQMYSSAGSGTALCALAAPNLVNIDSDVQTDIYVGDAFDTAVLTAAGKSVSGGIVAAPPYLFALDNDGVLSWCDADDPTTWGSGDAGDARITGSKLIIGKPVRSGASNSPAVLIWSLDSLYRISYVGGSVLFRSDFVGGTAALSSSCVVEYNGLYFWPTSTQQFVVFNGTIQLVQNELNKDFFFDNLNWTQVQKVHGVAIYEFNEIWWFYPSGTSEECDRVIIYNVQLNTWYDTSLDRASAFFGQTFRWPLMFGTTPNASSKYALWQHEFGYDEIGNSPTAIQAYYTTRDISFISDSPEGGKIGIDRNIFIDRLEPDFVQTGNMTVEVIGNTFSEESSVVSAMYTMPEPPFDPGYIDVHEEYRRARLKFESNTLGGYFQQGQVLIKYAPGSAQP